LFSVASTSVVFVGLELILRSPRPKRFITNLFRTQRLKHAGEEPTEEELDRLASKTVIKLVNESFNLVQVPLAFYVLGQPELKSNKLYGISRASRALNNIGAGFFLQDLGNVIRRYKTAGPEMLLHAGVCCPIYIFASQKEMAHFFSSGFMLWELSTPFVHAREIMAQMKMGKTKAYAINGVLMIAVFFACRNVYGNVLLFQFWRKSREDIMGMNPDLRPPGKRMSKATAYTIRTCGVAMSLLNGFWFSKMIQGAMKLFVGKK